MYLMRLTRISLYYLLPIPGELIKRLHFNNIALISSFLNQFKKVADEGVSSRIFEFQIKWVSNKEVMAILY